MGKWFSLFLAGLVLTAAAAGRGPQLSGEHVVRDMVLRPLGPGVPDFPPPYLLYLPVVSKGYVPGYVSPFGIDMYGNNSEADGQAKMQAAGAAWETVNFNWVTVEPNAPVSGTHTYNWSSFDGVVARAQASGMNLFVQFTSNPAWAAARPEGPVNPANLVDVASMAAAAAERYDGDGLNDAPGSPVVMDWSIYGEPDHQSHWGNDPTGYADMIAAVATAMHAANPHVVVMLGGLAYDGFTPTGNFVESFLGNVLDRLNANHGGAAASLAAVPFHYYPINSAWPTIKEKTAEIRSILTAHGAGTLPLLVPEMGYWSGAVNGVPSWTSTPDKQAGVLVEMYVRGLSVGLTQMSWFAVFDAGPGTEEHGLFSGFGPDLDDPKPAYTAYGVMTAQLYGGQYASQLSGSGIEGYVFSMTGGPQKTVVWATTASANVSFHLGCIRQVDYMGIVTTIGDGTPTWDKDATVGQITLQALQDQPLYVSGC